MSIRTCINKYISPFLISHEIYGIYDILLFKVKRYMIPKHGNYVLYNGAIK